MDFYLRELNMARKSFTHSDPVLSPGAAPARVSKPKASRNQNAKTAATTVGVAEMTGGVAEMSADREQIAHLAYSYWEARGRQDGSPEQDWLRAEQELRGKRAASAIA
jgi:hypothetical protein